MSSFSFKVATFLLWIISFTDEHKWNHLDITYILKHLDDWICAIVLMTFAIYEESTCVLPNHVKMYLLFRSSIGLILQHWLHACVNDLPFRLLMVWGQLLRLTVKNVLNICHAYSMMYIKKQNKKKPHTLKKSHL